MAGCGEFQGELAAEVYGELGETERRALEEHLRGCAACRGEREELGRAAEVLGRGGPALSLQEREALRDEIRDRIARSRPARTRRVYVSGGRPPVLAWAAAAAVFIAALSAVLLLRKPEVLPAPEVAVEAPAPHPQPPIETPVPAPKPEPPAPRIETPAAPVPPTPPTPKPEAPAPVPPPPPAEEKPQPVESPKPAPAVEKPTIAVLATVESVRGESSVKVGQALVPGQEVRAAGRTSFKYPDGTRVEIGPAALVRFPEVAKGKSIFVVEGSILANVVKQPAGQPVILATPHAEATVLGTTLALRVSADATRLEVREGRVRFTRLEDRASIDVSTGHQALAMKGRPFASRLGRVATGLQALYLFDEGRGQTVYDASGSGAPLDLEIRRPRAAQWGPGGLTFSSPNYAASAGPATKVFEACRQTGEVTLEAWVKPAAAAPTFEGVIFGLSNDRPERNLTLMQGESPDMTVWAVSMRTSQTDPGGNPILATPKGSAEARLAHVVYTRSAAGSEKLYVNGMERAAKVRKGDLGGWSDAFRLVLGNEPTEERPWQGELRLVAVYNRALAPVDVVRHFRVGGEDR